MGPPFRYKEYTDARRSLEDAIVKKAGLWLCIHFCEDARNKLVLACILCKKIVIKFLWDCFKYNFVHFKWVWIKGPVWFTFTHKLNLCGHCVILGLEWVMLLYVLQVVFWVEIPAQRRLYLIFVKL